MIWFIKSVNSTKKFLSQNGGNHDKSLSLSFCALPTVQCFFLAALLIVIYSLLIHLALFSNHSKAGLKLGFWQLFWISSCCFFAKAGNGY
jgi:hypothetical protein